MSVSYRVTAPYVTLKVLDPQSGKHVFLGFYAGAPVPSNVDPESLQAHVDGGMVTELEAAAAPAEVEPAESAKTAPSKSTAKPAGK